MKIPIKKYQDDPSLSWEERYRRLEAHHLEETSWMIDEIKKLENFVEIVRTERKGFLELMERFKEEGKYRLVNEELDYIDSLEYFFDASGIPIEE